MLAEGISRLAVVIRKMQGGAGQQGQGPAATEGNASAFW
jgi:hypothetical protein